MNPEVIQALDQGARIITATRRLSYEVKAAYDAYKIKQGNNVWQTADVVTWDGWMQTLWHDANAYTAQTCLSNSQLLALLVDIIKADLNNSDTANKSGITALWNIPATAKTALDAWQLCHQWRLSYSRLQASEHDDHARFGRWATQLYAHLRRKDWISNAEIADLLIATKIKPEQDAVIFGFDYLNTQQQNFIKFYRTQGSKLIHINSKDKQATHLRRFSFDSPRTEWRQIGAWARDKLTEHPHLKIGVVTPDTESIRALAQQSLREQLIPAYFELQTPDPFHFSKGQKLSEVPLIHSALACLTLLGDIEFKQLTGVFLSNYWGSVVEQDLRAQVVVDLRRKIAYRFDLYEFIKVLSSTKNSVRNTPKIGATLLEKLGALQSIKADNRGAQNISTWRDVFKLSLKALGWPVPGLDSTEFQARKAWERMLEQWIKLETVCQPMSLMQALQSLNSFSRETTFQAQAQVTAPIQIMGVLEAAELDFDAVWLAGFDEQVWPVVTRTSPFIPASMQSEAGIPDASLALQAEFALKKTAQLCALCDEVNFSHARIQDDIELAVSLIMPDTSCSDSSILPSVFSINDTIRAATPVLLSRTDDIGCSYDETTARGGTGLIQKQSACPFSAYARYRLQAGEDDEPRIGMDSLERGNLLHKTLEAIWAELEDSEALLRRIERNTLGELIHSHTRAQIRRFARRSGLGKGFIRAETLRLDALIAEWLELEAQRPAFKVEAVEQRIEHQINGLKLNFTLDRVDQLTAQHAETASEVTRLIMDYKSGKCNLKDWVGKRPNQPQIPLYYLALKSQNSSMRVDALTFAQLKPGECEFVGISRRENTLPDVDSLEALGGSTSLKKDIREWSELKSKWQTRIDQLVKDYQQGLANVDPKNSNSCTYCSFGPLCRIHTRNLREENDVS